MDKFNRRQANHIFVRFPGKWTTAFYALETICNLCEMSKPVKVISPNTQRLSFIKNANISVEEYLFYK